MATKLSISDLRDILAVLKELSEPYQLGIQLNIPSSTLKTIEKNHPGNIDRLKIEVIEYWLCNSPNTSWTTLANAVERLGGHANLVQRLGGYAEVRKTLREEELSSEDPSLPLCSQRYYAPMTGFQSSPVSTICLETCVDRDVLLLGKMGNGKSTLGNRMLNYDGCFMINNQKCNQTCKGSAILSSTVQCKNYKINIYDHDGLFEGVSSIDTFSSDIPKDLNLVIFVLKHGHSFDAKERQILSTVMSEWKISRISALVLTHCEHLSEQERERMIKQFKENHPSITELMGKGILAVGFPGYSHVQSGSQLSQSVEDEKKVRQLIYSCDEKIIIRQTNIRHCSHCSIL